MGKKVALLLILALCAGVLFGCSNTTPAAQGDSGSSGKKADISNKEEEVYIDIWGLWKLENYRGEWMQNKANEYCANHPGVTIEYIYQNSYDGVADKLTAGAISGELPVLAQMEESFITKFHPICLSFDDYMAKEDIDNYRDGLMVNGVWEGKTLAVPANRSMPMLYINANILDACGLNPEGPQTWDEFYNYAKTITERTGKPAFSVYFDADAWVWESVLYSWGGSVASPDGLTATFGENNAGVHFIELLQRMIKEGLSVEPFSGGHDPDDYNGALFLDQEIAMCINSCGDYRSLAKDATFPIKVCYMPIGTERSAVTGGANWILCKGSTDAQIEHAIGFIKYLATDANILDWSITSGYMLSTESVLNYEKCVELFEKDPNYRTIYDQIEYAHLRPTTPSWREIYTYIIDKLEQAMIDPSIDPYALINDCVIKAQAIIDANKG